MLGNGVKHIGSRAHCASGSGNQPQKSLTHLFSFRDQRLWGDFRLIWILGLVTEKGNDTRNKFVPYGPELHEYMMWLKSCDVKRSRVISRTRGWLVDL